MEAESPARVLIVDESPGVLRIAETVLSEAGLEVRCLDDGRRTVEVARDIHPQLILVELTMSGVGGYDICKQLGDDPELEGVPIVIINARGDPVGDRFIRELGVVDHITKPFAPEALVAVVMHTLAKPNFRRRPFHLTGEMPDRLAHATAAQRLAAEIADALGHEEPEAAEQIANILEAGGTQPLLRDLFFELDVGAGLTGSLGIISIAEVLQLLSLQRQSGFLRVARKRVQVSIALKDGAVRLVTGENVRDEFLLGNILVRERLMQADELETLLANRKGTRYRLGTQIVKLGYVTQEQLHEALRRQSTELVYELLRWGTGRFTFTASEDLPDAVLEFEFGLSTDELLMEGYRRVDEWGLIEQALPTLDAVLEPVPGGAAHTGPQGLTRDEQAVLLLVDGQRTAREIIKQVQGGTFEVARLIYRLVAAKVVRARELTAEGGVPAPAGHDKGADAS